MKSVRRSPDAKGYVTLYLPLDVLGRVKAAAAADDRSVSNYLAGLLERAHPPEGEVHDLAEVARDVRSRRSLAPSARRRGHDR